MSRYLTLSFVFFSLYSEWSLGSELPDSFLGVWDVHVVEQSGFPHWREIKYPELLTIRNSEIHFIDQTGYDCTLSNMIYDAELDVIVFKYCGPNKSERVVGPYWKIRIVDGRIHGETWTYKLLFKWIGEPIREFAERPENGDDLKSQVRYIPRPIYPPHLRNIEGFVDFEFDVTPSGLPRNIKVLKSTSMIFERSARNALEAAKFHPAKFNGVSAWHRGATIRIEFKLDEDAT